MVWGMEFAASGVLPLAPSPGRKDGDELELRGRTRQMAWTFQYPWDRMEQEQGWHRAQLRRSQGAGSYEVLVRSPSSQSLSSRLGLALLQGLLCYAQAHASAMSVSDAVRRK